MTSQQSPPIATGEHTTTDKSRRRLLNRLWLALGGLALVEIIWLVVSFLKPLKSTATATQPGHIIDAGPVDRFDRNTVTAFPRGRFYLACLPDGGFLALSRRCTHLGCTLPWDEKKAQFACPCHASIFDIHGEVIQSPAPRALDRFPVSIENNRVKVNIDQPIHRSAFRSQQVTYQ